MLVSGALVSTVHEWCAGLPSVFPAGSTARTSNLRTPSASPEYTAGDSHGVYTAPSREHSKRASSSAANVNLAEVLFDGSSGRSPIVVSGAVWSIVQIGRAHV